MSAQIPKRTHYVAKHYLAGWFIPDGSERLWTYHRGSGKAFLGGAEQVGLIRYFFPPDVERLLDRSVDQPGARVLSKIRSGEPVTPDDKAILAYYMAVQLKRVPRFRDWAKARLPQDIAKYEAELFTDLQRMVEDDPTSLEDVERFREEAAGVISRYKTELPDDFLQKLHLPWPSRRVAEAMFGMTWRFLIPGGSDRFVTSDNPVSLFTWLGVASQDSEIAFPISSKCCLHASWTEGPDCSYIETERQVLLEMNRRSIDGSNRFIFSDAQADWLQESVRKQRFELKKRITWSPHRQRRIERRPWAWSDQQWDPNLNPPPEWPTRAPNEDADSSD